MSRLFIYPKDIMIFTGKSERHARRIHLEIRRTYGKESQPILTVEDFCRYFNMTVDYVLIQLTNR